MGAEPDPRSRGLIRRVLRHCLREMVWPIVLLMSAGHRFGRVLLQTEYKIAGGCKQRGACCHHILLEWSPVLDRFPILGKLVLWKLTRLYSFFDRGYTWEIQEGLMARVLGCHALLPDGRCGEYRLRPMFCRTYPEIPLSGPGMVLKGCGYRFDRRDGKIETEPEGHRRFDPEPLVQIGRRIRS